MLSPWPLLPRWVLRSGSQQRGIVSRGSFRCGPLRTHCQFSDQRSCHNTLTILPPYPLSGSHPPHAQSDSHLVCSHLTPHTPHTHSDSHSLTLSPVLTVSPPFQQVAIKSDSNHPSFFLSFSLSLSLYLLLSFSHFQRRSNLF
jgi:hypothetical protein